MKEITVETLRAFFSRPTKAQVEKEAGLPLTTLSHVLKKNSKRNLTPEHIEKLKPVLKRYGF